MPKQRKGKWKRYNAWRSKNRELDRVRRLARIEAKKAVEPEATPVRVPIARVPAAWARIRIRFRDGGSASMGIYETPFGPTVSPTLAGRRLACLLANYEPFNRSMARSLRITTSVRD